MDLNKVMIAGRLTRDPELKVLPGGTEVVGFGVAMNRKWKDGNTGEAREEVTFVDVEFFGKRAAVIKQHFQRGKPIFVEGRLKLDQWEKDGEKKSKMKVVGENFEFLGDNRPAGGEQRESAPAARTPSYASSAPAQAPASTQAGMGIDDDQIPF